MNKGESTWDDGKIAQLKLMVAAGETYSAIGRRLGISRCAAIGEAKRLGLETLKPLLKPLPQRIKPTKNRSPFPKGNDPSPPAIVDLPRLPGEPEPMGDVERGCRWISGPAVERMFCGAPVVAIGCSWCLHHRNRVWATVSRAQAERELRKVHLAEVA